jgi:hypothetical protein
MFQKVGEILKRFDPTSGKYLSREFQAYGVFLAQAVGRETQITLY